MLVSILRSPCLGKLPNVPHFLNLGLAAPKSAPSVAGSCFPRGLDGNYRL